MLAASAVVLLAVVSRIVVETGVGGRCGMNMGGRQAAHGRVRALAHKQMPIRSH